MTERYLILEAHTMNGTTKPYIWDRAKALHLAQMSASPRRPMIVVQVIADVRAPAGAAESEHG